MGTPEDAAAEKYFTPPEDDLCPKCGSEVTRDSVDIGVGVYCGPARCDSCGWRQPVPDFGIKEQDILEDPGIIPEGNK